jgi:hypothetical protein
LIWNVLNAIQHLSIITSDAKASSSYAFGEYSAPLMAIMPVDHGLASRETIIPKIWWARYFVRSSTAASVAELSGNSQIYDG